MVGTGHMSRLNAHSSPIVLPKTAFSIISYKKSVGEPFIDAVLFNL